MIFVSSLQGLNAELIAYSQAGSEVLAVIEL